MSNDQQNPSQHQPEDPWAAWTPPTQPAVPAQPADSEPTSPLPPQPSAAEPTTPLPSQPPARGWDQPTEPTTPMGQQPMPGQWTPPDPWGAPAPARGADPWAANSAQPPAQPPQPPQPPAGGWGAPPTGGYPPPEPSAASSFFGALFDFTFHKFVTPSIVKVVYILAVVLSALTYVGWILGGFSENTGLGVVALLLGWIPALLIIALARVQLEYMVALIRTSEYTRDIKKHLGA